MVTILSSFIFVRVTARAGSSRRDRWRDSQAPARPASDAFRNRAAAMPGTHPSFPQPGPVPGRLRFPRAHDCFGRDSWRASFSGLAFRFWVAGERGLEGSVSELAGDDVLFMCDDRHSPIKHSTESINWPYDLSR